MHKSGRIIDYQRVVDKKKRRRSGGRAAGRYWSSGLVVSSVAATTCKDRTRVSGSSGATGTCRIVLAKGDAAHGADRYLFLVNSAQSAVEAIVEGLPASGVRRHDVLGGGTADDVRGGSFKVSLPMLGVKCFRFASPKFQ